MRNLRITRVLGFCFLLGLMLMAMVGCSTDQTEKIEVPQNTTTDTETDLSAIDPVDPADTVDPVDTVTPASLFAFELDDKGNPIIRPPREDVSGPSRVGGCMRPPLGPPGLTRNKGNIIIGPPREDVLPPPQSRRL